MGLDPLEPAVLREGPPGSLFQVTVPSLGLSVASLYSLQGLHNTLAVTNNSLGLAFLQSPDNR
eukprot:1499097-Amphidinium_carterae.1